MIGKTTAEVNRCSIPRPCPSLSSALDDGYEFRLSADLTGEVLTPDGHAYYVVDGVCNCPDRVHRGGSYDGRCKHEHWIAALFPCSWCGGTMTLGTAMSGCDGQVERVYICPTCNNARMESIVLSDRRIEAALRGDYTADPPEDGDSAPETCGKCGALCDEWTHRCEECGAPVGLHGRLAEAGELEAYMAYQTPEAEADRVPF